MSSKNLSSHNFHLGQVASELERKLSRQFEDILLANGFEYLSIPSTIPSDVLKRIGQEETLRIDEDWALAGSAEQGILWRFMDCKDVGPDRYWAVNQCWRVEDEYEGMFKRMEFKKIEQFVFCREDTWEGEFDFSLKMCAAFLGSQGLKWRFTDTSHESKEAVKKVDIEVLTKTYGWMETHSCTYFGKAQTDRMGIGDGELHTISNTGLAFPRILIPMMEKLCQM